MAFLEVEGLEYFAPNGNTMLRGVEFRLPMGAVLAIAGPNGAGKTTLLNLLSGMTEITHGDVLVDRQSLHRLSAV